MPFDFPAALNVEGLTFLEVNSALFRDRRTGHREVFRVYHFRDDTTGEPIMVAEHGYEDLLLELLVMNASGLKGGLA